MNRWQETRQGLEPCSITQAQRVALDIAARTVAQDEYPGARLATMFEAIDSGAQIRGRPLPYVTRVQRGVTGLWEDCERYETRDKALQGHQRWARHLRTETQIQRISPVLI